MKQTSHFAAWTAAWLCLALSACGGGGGSANGVAAVANLLTGQFIDSAVAGVTYTITAADGTVVTGVTDQSGTFQYQQGGSVKFSIGKIQLPAALGDSTVTPLSMAQGVSGPVASNVAYFLQSLDFDLNPSNGITIDPRVADLKAMSAFASTSIDWAQPTATFINNPNLKALWEQAKALNAANLIEPVVPPKTPAQTDQHLAQTLFGSLDTQAPQTEGCVSNSGIAKPSYTYLSSNLWADLMAKPKAPVFPGWIYDGEITQATALSAPAGDMRIYKATSGSVEYKTALKSVDVDNVDADLWLKHQSNPNVILRIAAKERLGGDSIYFPKYTGTAIYLHYVATDNSALEFQFSPGFESQAFFSFVGNNISTFYTGTAGKDGVLNQGNDDGWNEWTQERGDNWQRHHPAFAGTPADPKFNIAAVPARAADANFPPNMHKGGTTPMGRALGTTSCILKSGGSVLLWRKPNNASDLFFSPLALRNSVGELAPVYTDAKGYQGFAGIRAGIQTLRVLK